MSLQNPVRPLNAEVARKIAAGEVIDRPNAIIRELMDNAIDSGATSITVEITGGGIEKIRIIDNGCGMTKDDLFNCARPHATSKISTETDLMNLSTLGFRGEALASIAAVARLSIISGGWKMRASITEDHIIEQVAATEGTIVQSEGLFENFPARRVFLKRAATEGVMCKNTFIEKTLSRPDIAFRFVNDGETKIDLPANQSLKERFIAANSYKEDKSLFFELESVQLSENPDWSFKAVIGEPAVSRSNKKEIFIYVNGRRISEYSLVQAVEYGGQGFFPNGTYPVAAVFVNINPNLVDFNIHPAKKEVRFYDSSDLHHGLSSTIRGFFQQYTKNNFENDLPTDFVQSDFDFVLKTSQIPQEYKQTQTQNPSYAKHISYKSSESSSHQFSDFRSKYLGIKTKEPSFSQPIKSLAEEALNDFSPETTNISEKNNYSQNTTSQIKFLGCTLGTFILVEKNNCLYIIDQHAVHERILFDKLMNNQGNTQALLIPYKIKTESKTQDNQLEKLKDKLTQIGFETTKIQDGEWHVTSIPERWTGSEFDLRTLLFVKQVEPDQIIRSIAAMTACKAAVKDGYILDEQVATELAEQAFSLPDPHCPHGRPVYAVLSKEQLFEMVKRT